MNIGDNIKMFRTQKGWTQEDVADKMGLTRFSIANWETGRRKPSVDAIKQLAAIFNVEIEHLIGVVDSSTDSVTDLIIRAEQTFKDAGLDDKEREKLFRQLMTIYLETKGKED